VHYEDSGIQIKVDEDVGLAMCGLVFAQR